MATNVRVRFAPSPTGFQHIGGIRSALFNWLWARHNNGTFILRIEDTDRARLVEGAVAQIEHSLNTLGITPDEGPESGGEFGPYTQSERLHFYAEYANKLLASKALYPCWCTPERLTELREQTQREGKAFKYNRHCLVSSNQKSMSEPHVLRFRIPETPTTIAWNDAVRGKNEWHAKDLDDFVAIKSDGWPTYHFANVVDDHLMEISHVLRADEWLPSTPKHLLLFAAFGWKPPIYAHLPAILGPGGNKKLSKRDGAKSVSEYISEGYLPETIINFLALLGWNEGDGSTQEIYSKDELIKKFSLERIQKSPAKFDPERLTWMNGEYIRDLSVEELGERVESFWPAAAKDYDKDYKQKALGLVHERLKFLAELPELTDFFFTDPDPSSISQAKVEAGEAKRFIEGAIAVLSKTTFEHDPLEQALRQLAEALETKPGPLFSVLRTSTTGKTAAPGLFETMAVLGQETVLRRLKSALEKFTLDKT